MTKRHSFLIIIFTALSAFFFPLNAQTSPTSTFDATKFEALKFRNIGPFRGGRSVAVTGVRNQPMTYYFGSTGGGIWKTEDAGMNWKNISDGFLKTGSVGAIAVAPNDSNVLYVGMGEHPVRGVMTSAGDGMYRSTDGGQTWQHIGLKNSEHIAAIRIHPTDSETVWVAVQGALWKTSTEKGIYKTTDGGKNWRKVLFVDAHTGAADLSLDATNPRILYAGMWDHQRYPWKVRSGGKGSGIWKSVDSGETWTKLTEGLPDMMGKIAVDVSPVNPNRIFANIEAEKGGVFRSDDGGKKWKQVNSSRVTVARAWYYIEIFADPQNENGVYVLNAPVLKSLDGGKSFQNVKVAHTDQHDLWINPDNPKNMILGNDGGACITFNGGQSWSTQDNQSTAQFYRVIADEQFPYRIYGGQQDNSAISIASRTQGQGIAIRDWHSVAGGESAFLAFDPKNPQKIYGTSITGFIDVYDSKTGMIKDIMAYPSVNLGRLPKDMKYRFNWNNPIVAQPQNPNILYYGAQKVLRSDNGGLKWIEISPDLTRNDTTKHGAGGEPFTNEAAGGEIYNTISYIQCSPTQAGVIWVGTDDGRVHLTLDEGKDWQDITPKNLPESLINTIEVSPHDPATAYLAVTRYKFGDTSPMIYMTNDYGGSWRKAIDGLPKNNFVRVVREDKKRKGLLYAGTERGLYLSFDNGKYWTAFQANLPVTPITDLTIADNDLVVATAGRAFWILDDLSALQQSNGAPNGKKLKLFSPKSTVKFNTSTPPKPPVHQGANVANGVVFDYYLPHNWADSSELILEIKDVFQNTIRTYSNKKSKKQKSWIGGPPPAQILPAKAGLNRFNWDLRRETLPAVEGIFVMGDYRGHLVNPGDYLFKMMSEKDTSVAMIKVLADPRLTTNLQEHGNQQIILMQIETAVKDMHQSVNQLRSIKKQLSGRLELLREMEERQELVKLGEKALTAITKWEEKLIQPKQKTFQDVINFPNQLNAELLGLKGQIDQLDPQPTYGAKLRVKELTAEWATYKKDIELILQREVALFNRMYAEAKLPVLILPKE
jgi:photosystem II stability/assembly factor-like uncharacterized protein